MLRPMPYLVSKLSGGFSAANIDLAPVDGRKVHLDSGIYGIAKHSCIEGRI